MIVIDAGGGTIDVSGYAIEGESPLRVEEIFASECTSISLFHASLSNVRSQVVCSAPRP